MKQKRWLSTVSSVISPYVIVDSMKCFSFSECCTQFKPTSEMPLWFKVFHCLISILVLCKTTHSSVSLVSSSLSCSLLSLSSVLFLCHRLVLSFLPDIFLSALPPPVSSSTAPPSSILFLSPPFAACHLTVLQHARLLPLAAFLRDS